MTFAFWVTAALLLAGALLFVVPPLLRPGKTNAGPSPLTAYRDQRAQADAELAQGTLTPEQHAQALDELQRRVIEEVGEVEESSGAPAAHQASLVPVLAVALLVPAGALALYGLLGKPSALSPVVASATSSGSAPHTMSREEMEGMVDRLAEKLKANPNDADGWHMLARSYVSFNRLAEAAQAYDRASALAPKDPNVLADYADTLAMLNGRSLEGRPTELVMAALQLDPRHAKSLSLAGTAAFNRKDFPTAITYWQRLLTYLPPESDGARSVAASIAQAEAAARQTASTGATDQVPSAAAATARTAAAAAGGSSIEGSVAIADALKARISAGDTVFVFARAVEGPRMPIAIVRSPVGKFPFGFKLDDSSAMTPQFKLSSQGEVMLAARISRTGNATPQSGDLMGTFGPVKVGARDVKLVIDGVVP